MMLRLSNLNFRNERKYSFYNYENNEENKTSLAIIEQIGNKSRDKFSQDWGFVEVDKSFKLILINCFIIKVKQNISELIFSRNEVSFNTNQKGDLKFYLDPNVENSLNEVIELKTSKFVEKQLIFSKLSSNCDYFCVGISNISNAISLEIIIYDCALKIYKSRFLSLSDFDTGNSDLKINDIYYSDNQFILNIGFKFIIVLDNYTMNLIYFVGRNENFSPVLNLKNEITSDKILYSEFLNNENDKLDLRNKNIKNLYIKTKTSTFKINLERKTSMSKHILSNILENKTLFLNEISNNNITKEKQKLMLKNNIL